MSLFHVMARQFGHLPLPCCQSSWAFSSRIQALKTSLVNHWAFLFFLCRAFVNCSNFHNSYWAHNVPHFLYKLLHKTPQEFYLIFSHFEQALKSYCLCFSKALSLAGKKIQLRPKCGAICELMALMRANQIVRITRDFKMDVIEKNIN